MKKFIIERTIPGIGEMTREELSEIAQKSNAVLRDFNTSYHWLHSYVAGDKLFCVHIAPDKETVLKHSAMGCFPVDQVYEVQSVIDPTTENQK
jgi:hypothetical protein